MTSHPPIPTKITKVILNREHSAAASSATSRSQSSSEFNPRRTSIPSKKRGRSPSSSSASESSSSASIKRQRAFEQDDVDIDVDELYTYDDHHDSAPNSTAAGATTSTSSIYPVKAYPCIWVERRARFMLPFILENAPCHRGFDTETELFAHYAWHIDQLGIDHECEVGTCRMKILSDEHLKTHYQQMHPNLPIPQELHIITSTAKSTRRVVAAATTSGAGKGSQSKRSSSGAPRESITPPPRPPSLLSSYIKPPPTTPTKARTQPKLQQTKISEGWKLKTSGNGPLTSTTPYHSALSTQHIHSTTTQGKPTTTTTYLDYEDEDPTPPMAFGPFFKKK
ncbi:hypothetical protein BGW39_008958 [Mortierella sp. 14UC]|nr:hypothetical protein BGW39_008958 [Mortierella sp. 14UC]